MRTLPILDAAEDGRAQQSNAPGKWRQWLMCIVWPAFMVAGIAEAIFFTLFDPGELQVFGAPSEASRTAIYSIGFFCFWALFALSSAGTLMLRESTELSDPPARIE